MTREKNPPPQELLTNQASWNDGLFAAIIKNETRKGRMAEWVPVGKDFIVADVIRWKEGVFKNRYRKRGKPTRTGERLVTAEVLRDEAGWVYLLVRGCEVLSAAFGRDIRDIPALSKKTEIKRKRTTIVRGKAERLLWSDESARAVVVSQFPGDREA